jgi:hypothetical protein
MKRFVISLIAGLTLAKPVPNDADYEYVVIGSGPGGGTLA